MTHLKDNDVLTVENIDTVELNDLKIIDTTSKVETIHAEFGACRVLGCTCKQWVSDGTAFQDCRNCGHRNASH